MSFYEDETGRTLIYFDIETVSQDTPPPLESVKVPKTYKKAESIEKYQKENLEKAWRAQALNPQEGFIFCISYAINDGEPQTIRHESEIEMLQAFFLVLEKYQAGYDSEVLLIAHNIKFDALWIYQRALRYRMPALAQMFMYRNKETKYYNYRKVCTMFLAGGGIEYKYSISLNNLANLLQLESHKNTISGAEVFDYWRAGKEKVILDYCEDDVILLRNIYKLIGYEF